MSITCHARVSSLLLAVAFGLLITSGVRSQSATNEDKALLEQTKKRLAIEAQKVEAEIRESLLQAQRQADTDAAKAVASMKTILARVDDETTLPESRRDALKRMLKDRIRVTEDQAKNAAAQADAKAESKAKTAGRRNEEETKALEEERQRAELKHIGRLQSEGKTDEATRQASNAASRNPSSPAANAAKFNTSMNDRVATARGIKQETESRRLGGLQDVDRSAMLPRGDIEYPADWAKKTKDRGAVRMTEKEKALMKALNTPIPLNFKDTKLEDAIEYLQTISGQTIVVDKSALDDVKVAYDTLITVQIRRPVTMRTALRKVLQDLGLAYYIKDGEIQVTSSLRAKETMTVRAYYIGDIAAVTDVRLPLVLNQINTIQAGNDIVKAIQESIDPQSWRANGGEGTIFFDVRTMTILVKQTAEVHYMLSGTGK
jgi:hypothetical protein